MNSRRSSTHVSDGRRPGDSDISRFIVGFRVSESFSFGLLVYLTLVGVAFFSFLDGLVFMIEDVSVLVAEGRRVRFRDVSVCISSVVSLF